MNDLTHHQRRLADYVSSLSEQAWSAGWMRGLEHELWQAVVSGPCKVGQIQITEAHIDCLRRLSADCEGWIVFDEATEETFVPIERWKVRHANRLDCGPAD